MIPPLILNAPADQPLREILHPFDCYELFDELEDKGIRAEWRQVLAWQSEGVAGDVARWCGRVVA